MLNKAGSEMIMANSSFLTPLAAFMRRNTRPIRNTRTTRNNVGVIKISSKTSSNTIPGTEKYVELIYNFFSTTKRSLTEIAGVPCMTKKCIGKTFTYLL